MLLIDCRVDNPEFGSQSKEALTTPASAFGGTARLPDAFIRSVAAIDGLGEAVAVLKGAFEVGLEGAIAMLQSAFVAGLGWVGPSLCCSLPSWLG